MDSWARHTLLLGLEGKGTDYVETWNWAGVGEGIPGSRVRGAGRAKAGESGPHTAG